jgi:hypothetical protein
MDVSHSDKGPRSCCKGEELVYSGLRSMSMVAPLWRMYMDAVRNELVRMYGVQSIRNYLEPVP